MPNLDGTGPAGQGPVTGRGLGKCNVCGRFMGMSRCRGCGLGLRRFWASSEVNVEDLKTIKSQLEEDLDEVNKEISSVENNK